MGRPHIKSKGGGQRNKQHLYKYQKDRLHKKGFKSIYKKGKSINISNLSKLSKESEINIIKFGYSKVLGNGELDNSIKKVIAKSFSKKALEKIEKAGAVAEILGGVNESENISTDNQSNS